MKVRNLRKPNQQKIIQFPGSWPTSTEINLSMYRGAFITAINLAKTSKMDFDFVVIASINKEVRLLLLLLIQNEDYDTAISNCKKIICHVRDTSFRQYLSAIQSQLEKDKAEGKSSFGVDIIRKSPSNNSFVYSTKPGAAFFSFFPGAL